MPIRGKRSIWPRSRPSPTGMFSSKGKQKLDSTESFDNKAAKTYAHSTNHRSKPKNSGQQSLRHQKPVKQW